MGHRLYQLWAASWEETGCHSQEGYAAEVLKCWSVMQEEGTAQGRKSIRDPVLTAMYLVAASFFFIKQHPALDSTCFFHMQVLVVNEDLFARIWINHSSTSPDSVRAAHMKPAQDTKPLVCSAGFAQSKHDLYQLVTAHKLFLKLLLEAPQMQPGVWRALCRRRHGWGPCCCSSQHQ